MAQRITSRLVTVTFLLILVLLIGAPPARASEPSPDRYWSNERLSSEGKWSGVCDLRDGSLLWSETSLDRPSDIWLLDLSSGARSLIFRSELPALDLWEPAPQAEVWGDYVAYTSIGPDATVPYYADYELFLARIRPQGERVRLSQRDGIVVSELEIDDGYVAWVEEQEDRSDLYLCSIETKEVRRLASEDSPGFSLLLAMREGRVAWTNGASLYLYDIASSTNSLVTQGAEYVTPARISGNRLAWDQDGALWLRDLATGTTVKVADAVGGFNLSAEHLVWSTFEYNDGDGGVRGDIYLEELSTGTITRLTNDDELDLDPQVSDHWVVWLRGSLNGGELIAYDLATGRTSAVAPYAYRFLLDGDRIAWHEYRGKGNVFLARALRFSDVNRDQPFHVAIEDLARRGIVAGFGDGTFRPSDPLTRQQFAKMIVKTMEYAVTGTEVCPFSDVVSGVNTSDPFYPDKYVAVCAARGITQGKTVSSFAPYGSTLRQQLITMVTRAANLPDPPADYSPPFVPGQFFPKEHYHNARKAAYAGILDDLEGMGSNYAFLSPATRGEACLVLYNVLGR
jgi:hypothetical protein